MNPPVSSTPSLQVLLRPREIELRAKDYTHRIPVPGQTMGEAIAEALRLARGDAAIAARILLHYARTR